MKFNNVIGQSDLIEKLTKIIKDQKLSQAYLFSEKEGRGALAIAIGFAQYINCEQSTDSDSCGVCLSCIKYEKLIHPDLHFVFPVNTTKEVKSKAVSKLFMDNWRSAILENPYLNLYDWLSFLGIENKQGNIGVDESHEIHKLLSLKTFEAKYNVVIIWMAEKMNLSAANSLLKVLEEPPENTIFILTTSDFEALLPTITSRLQIINFKPIGEQEIKDGLQQKIELAESQLQLIAEQSDGNFLQALKNAANNHPIETSEFRNWMLMCYKRDVVGAVEWVDIIAKKGREYQKQYLQMGLKTFEQCVKYSYMGGGYTPSDTFVVKFSPFINELNLMDMIYQMEQAIYHIERNGNPKLIFLDLSLKIIKLLTIKPKLA